MIDRYDVVALLGVLLITGGCYLVYPPLALIVPGVLLLVLGLLGARPQRRR